MLIKVLIRIILGYVNIVVEGYYIERFINICISKNIFLWNIKREKSTLMYSNVGIKDFRKLKQVAKTTRCKIKIKSKKGLPFIMHKYKKRKMFAILLIVIISFFVAMSNMVWNIEVVGDEKIDKQVLIEELKNEGLKVGMNKKDVDTKEIINKVRLNRKDIAWVGINIEGTNAIVKVVAAEEKPEIINEEDYCNVVSEKDGIILKIDAVNGIPQVKAGDEIKKGDILIAGWIDGKYTDRRYVHANGEIKAKIYYSKKEKFMLNRKEEEKTGKEEKKYTININNFKINLNKRVSNFKKYDTISENKKLKLFSDFYLPVELLVITNFEKEEVEKSYSMEEAKTIEQAKLQEELEKQFNKENIIDKHVNFYESADSVEVEVIYEVLENIGTKEKISF